MNNIIKYGVIGSGVMGQEHIQNINIIENAEVVAICDTNEISRNKTKSLVKESTKFYNDLNDSNRNLLGPSQISWIENAVTKTKSEWTIFGQQVLMTKITQ